MAEFFDAYEKSCSALLKTEDSLIDDASVDVIITSPPYNIGHEYTTIDRKRTTYRTSSGDREDYPDRVSQQEYESLLIDFLKGSKRVLHENGILVIDIAEDITFPGSGTKWQAADWFIKKAKELNLNLYRDNYSYSSVDESPGAGGKNAAGPKGCQGSQGSHSFIQRVLIFGKHKQEESPSYLPKTNPFRERYVYGRTGRDEAYWPPELIDDFILFFELGEMKDGSKTILDPFMGTGLLGHRIMQYGCRFVGFEISKELCDEALLFASFEFASEIDHFREFCKKEFHELDNKKEFLSQPGDKPPGLSLIEKLGIRYLGVALYDYTLEKWKLPYDDYFGLETEKKGTEKRLKEAFGIIDKNYLLSKTLSLALGKGGEEKKGLAIIKQDSRIEVKLGAKSYSLQTFVEEYKFTGSEAERAFSIHGRMLSPGEYFAFLPLLFQDPFGTRILMYLTVFGKGFSDAILWGSGRALVETLGKASHEIAGRRVVTLSKLAYSHATRAAAVAIISRNMSHHLGSHVIPRAGLETVAERVDKLLGNSEGLYSEDLLAMLAVMKGRLDDYLRQKADFIAEMPTEPGSSAASGAVFRDVILPLISNVLLIDCLAANEGCRYKNWDESGLQFRVLVAGDSGTREVRSRTDCGSCSRIKCGSSAEQVQRPYGAVPYGTRCMEALNKEVGIFIEEEDLDPVVAWPGSLGQYALYGIIENVVRNAAKHNREKLDGSPQLCVTLKIQDAPGEDHFELLLYDSLSDPNKRDSQGQKLCDRIQDLLDKPIIDTDGSTRKVGWGLAEIMICANLLIGRTQFTNGLGERDAGGRERKIVRTESMKLGDLEGNNSSIKGDEDRLVFRMKLVKPRRALIVGEQLFHDLCNVRGEKEWRRDGIQLLKDAKALQEFLKEIGTTVAVFQFAVLENGVLESLGKSEWRRHLPRRVIRVNGTAPTERIDESTRDLVVAGLWGDACPRSADDLMFRLWSNWCGRWLGDADGLVSISLDIPTGEKNMIAEAWANSAAAFNGIPESERSRIRMCLAADNDQASPPTASRTVIFDRHGHADYAKGDKGQESYIPFDKRTGDFLSIFQPRFPRDAMPWSFPFELFEAGMCRVLLIDERIAERAMYALDEADSTTNRTRPRVLGVADDTHGPRMWHLAFSARVLIATHILFEGNEMALHGLSYDAAEASTMENSTNTCPKAVIDLGSAKSVEVSRLKFDGKPEVLLASDFDVVVVHQGVLDTFGSERGKLLGSLKSQYPWIVIESGRGMPVEVQISHDLFLPFSAVDQCIGRDRIAKVALVKRLMELTRTKRDTVRS